MKAVVAYQKKLNSSTSLPKPLKLDQEMEKKRKVILKSFSLARNLYERGSERNFSKESELEPGAEFLEVSSSSWIVDMMTRYFLSIIQYL